MSANPGTRRSAEISRTGTLYALDPAAPNWVRGAEQGDGGRHRAFTDWSSLREVTRMVRGDVTEWPKVLASKARVGKPTGGSNPSITARKPPDTSGGFSVPEAQDSVVGVGDGEGDSSVACGGRHTTPSMAETW